MAKKQDNKITEKLNEVYGGPADVALGDMLNDFQLKGGQVAKYYTMAEIEDVLKNNKYHSPLYKQLKAILKANNHWRDHKKGGSFGPGNPYRFTRNK